MKKLSELTLAELISPSGFDCDCGRHHDASAIKYINVSSGCINDTVSVLKQFNISRLFIVMGENSRRVAGNKVIELLESESFRFNSYCFPEGMRILPNEEAVDLLLDNLPDDCDFILGIGSGVINDLCKYVGSSKNIPTGIVATAPSMDGYASNSSAMELGGVKTTVYTNIPTLILCDTAIIKDAPLLMIQSGCGDMAAKLISIADWKVSNIINGEYYCDDIADLMMGSFERIIKSRDMILARDEDAIKVMTEGLLISGIASSLAGVSRPASGMEHTISHLLEMFALSEGNHPYHHGIQVGYGTRIALQLYKALNDYQPTSEVFEENYSMFKQSEWEQLMHFVFKSKADALIAGEKKSSRNSYDNCKNRCSAAIENWSKIKTVAESVLDMKDILIAFLDVMEIPDIHHPEVMGYTLTQAENAVKFSRDLRDRYVLTSLCWDIGLFNYKTDIINTFCKE